MVKTAHGATKRKICFVMVTEMVGKLVVLNFVRGQLVLNLVRGCVS